MAVPATIAARIQAILDQAFDSKIAALQAKARGQKIDVTERFDVNGRVVKVRIHVNDPDFQKEIVLRIKFKETEADLVKGDGAKN